MNQAWYLYQCIHPERIVLCLCFFLSCLLFFFGTHHKLTITEMLTLLIVSLKDHTMSIYLIGTCPFSAGVSPSWKCWNVAARVRPRRARAGVLSREANNRQTDAQFYFGRLPCLNAVTFLGWHIDEETLIVNYLLNLVYDWFTMELLSMFEEWCASNWIHDAKHLSGICRFVVFLRFIKFWQNRRLSPSTLLQGSSSSLNF